MLTELYKYIFENTSQNKIDKEVAINIIKKLKEEEYKIENKEDIAITGIALEFPQANDVETWWEVLKKGTDCISAFPINRKQDLNKYSDMVSTKFYSGAYLNEIDNFDYSFFSISPKEASLMDPYQRIFLQKAWQVIEDAGYKPEDLYGSRTGVYVGHSCDFGESYKTIVDKLEPTSGKISTAGNIHSIIASRICHVLNLKGPSIMIDTACSSSLVSVHLACKAIHNKECIMAIAGGVKLNILPVYKEASLRTGIESSTEKTCTFDDSGDGTGLGEGCALIFLKPLKKAIQDRDNIYAVIKGSAINQDGNSIGITAPNAESQEDVIVRAWRDAHIDPESIDYIEAHGTGTRLGDPIEIDAISKAFRRYTDKKQFCGIGSVKTNIGHLDNASGIAGLIKIAISLTKCKIIPSINFNTPNRNIDFQNSPVYINDILREWEISSHPRRCGISSFGLSGTNCHMILEEAPKYEISDECINNSSNLFKLSAKSYESLNQMLSEYSKLLELNRDIEIESLCFTANTRRSDYNLRAAIIASDIDSLREKINKILCIGIQNIKDDEIYFKDNDNSKNKIFTINKTDSLEYIARKYVEGAKLNWDDLYDNRYKLVRIPTYQFKKSPCWIGKGDIEHPFLRGEYIENNDEEIYISVFSAKNQWIVNEHKIYEKNVPPGTVYVEMVCEIGKRHFDSKPFEIKEITFLVPMIFEKDEAREVRITLNKSIESLKFNIESKGDKEIQWIMHATGRLEKIEESTNNKLVDVESLKTKYTKIVNNKDIKNYGGDISLSDRWKTIEEMYTNKDGSIVYLALNEKYYQDSNEFNLHPVLLDMAVNILIKDYGNELYLPFSYRNLKFYRKMPNRFYSLIKNNNTIKPNMETISYSVIMFDEYGNVFAEVDDYSIKRVDKSENLFKNTKKVDKFIHNMEWYKVDLCNEKSKDEKGYIILYKDYNYRIERIINELEQNKYEIIKVQLENNFKKINDKHYLVGNTEDDFLTLFNILEKENSFKSIINALNFQEFLGIDDGQTLKIKIDDGIISLINITKVIVNNKFLGKKELIVLTDNAYEVIGTEEYVKPLNASVIGMAKVINQEYENINVKCIDIDDNTKDENILNEIFYIDEYKFVALREDNRFIQRLVTSKYNEFAKEKIITLQAGTYIITGGTGGIGLEVAKYLSLKGKLNICLIGKNEFVSKDKWDEILMNSKDEKLKRKINILKSIEETGSHIEIYKADVSIEKEVIRVISDIRNKFKSIKGVFHAAGIPGDGFIMRKEKHKSLNVINPKIFGTWLLDKYTNEDNLDIFVLFSSITSKMGGKGQGDYTAANSFLDSYAALRNRKGRNTIVINWGPWKEVGMAFDNGAINYEGPLKPISTVDAIYTLDKIISNGINGSIVGELNEKFLLNNIDMISFELDTSIKNKLQVRWIKDEEIDHILNEERDNFNVVLTGKNHEYTQTEKLISKIVGNVIGMRKININETFKNMGIDSIVASIVVRNIDEEFPNMVSIADFYTYPNILQIAAYIDKNNKNIVESIDTDKEKEEELKELLKSLKTNDVSNDDILEFLTGLGGGSNE